MINPKTIDEIKSRMDVVEVVSDFVQLKKSGSNYKALSPFTQEKTPSFFVSPAKQIFKCFSTSKGGDAISFIMEVDGLSYVEALKYLAKKYNVELEEEQTSDEDQQRFNERESLFIILNFAKDYYKDLLWENEEGQAIGLSYFKERGFTEETIKAFDLGYSLDIWDGLIKATKDKQYNEDLLEKAGLKIVKDNRSYDRFRGRVIFPIHNVTGKVIAFGARILKKAENQPKYINSPETELYQKSKILYGISQAKQEIRIEDNCYLVEGYTDVVSMYQNGVKNVVASSGTSLTEDQIKLISRYTSNVTVLFDGDKAGIKASLRGIDMLLEGDLNVRAVSFPDGEDPDSYAQKMSTSSFQNFLKEASVDFIVFKANLLVKETKNDPVKKAETIRDIVTSISKIPDPIKRTVYIKECSDLLDIDEAVLVTEQNKILVREQRNAHTKAQQESVDEIITDAPDKATAAKLAIEDAIAVQERECIRMLLNYADQQVKDEDDNDELFISYFLHELDDVAFETPVYQEILQHFVVHLKEGQLVNQQVLMGKVSEEAQKQMIDILADRYEISSLWHDKFKIIVPKEVDSLKKSAFTSVLRLKFRLVQKMIKANREKLMEDKPDKNEEDILRMHNELKKLEISIASELGNVTAR
ncbi:MAG: DNA primase [Cyclobacteriaceae bacterium]